VLTKYFKKIANCPEFPLVSPKAPNHLPAMIRIKTLTLPFVTALAASAVAPLEAQVIFQLSSQKTYRQNRENVIFKGGSFDVTLTDGHVTSIFGCDDPNYFPPGFYVGRCSPGTAGYLSYGNIGSATVQRPYLVLTELAPAVAIAPKVPDFVSLTAAPASDLRRPAGGFSDDSASVYYNLHTPGTIREYELTGYFLNREYNQDQRSKFEGEIVPGAYRYSFPRLGRPSLPAPITAVIYPMPEGYGRLNNQKVGVQFTQVNENNWVKGGFLEMSYSRPNQFQWRGITPSNTFAAVDKLYFSLRAMRNPADAQNSDVIRSSAIFPAFVTGTENVSRVQLRSPYVTSFITPPILPSGTKAIAELEIERDFKTGGVTYDFSRRRFQLPVTVIDRYSDYAELDLATAKNKALLADPDKDGYNNLTEWILESDGSEVASIPEMPVPEPFQAVDIVGGPTPIGSYFGFNVTIKEGTNPKVSYILQRSLDQGRTWRNFRSGYYFPDGSYATPDNPPDLDGLGNPLDDVTWSVRKVRTIERGIETYQIQVRSGIIDYTQDNNYQLEPPGTQGDLYRVKIVLKKKKK
jgi:hypothetical protein